MSGTTSNAVAIAFFFVFMGVTLAITRWAARKTRTAEDFFVAGGHISAEQNGFALAGDYLSAAALLGVAAIITANGFDGLIYGIGWLCGWPIVLLLVAEPLRNLGRFTFADVVAYRLSQRPIRAAASVGTLVVILFYLIAQMVATGSLIELLFGLPYASAVVFVGAMMLVYVLFGGMLATTWVQIVKAALLLVGACVMAVLVLARFDMNPLHLFAAAAQRFGPNVLQPGHAVASNAWDAMSLGIGLVFGTAGMPHILMRVFTVPDVRQCRQSILYATGLIGFFHLLVLVIGFGAMVLVGPAQVVAAGGGGNMAAPLLARLVGGDAFFGFICAVSFATMLAVVAGLVLSGAAALTHDLWSGVVRQGKAGEREQMRVAKLATVGIAIAAILLGLVFQGQNVAFMAGLAYAVACSANFPVLVLAIFWPRLTTAGAVASILTGTVAALVLIVLSPTIQVDILHKSLASLAHAWWFVPLHNPAIVSMPLAFAAAIAVSLIEVKRSDDQTFEAMRLAMIFGRQNASIARLGSGRRIGMERLMADPTNNLCPGPQTVAAPCGDMVSPELDLLREADRLALRYVDGIESRRVYPDADAITGLAAFDEAWSQAGRPPLDTLRLLDRAGSPATAASTGARYFGYVVGGVLPAAAAAERLAITWDQRASSFDSSPVAAVVEQIAARWILEALDLPRQSAVGFGTSATACTIACLATARRALLAAQGWDVDARGLAGAPPLRVVASAGIHVAVRKALRILGFGLDNIIAAPVDAFGRIDAARLPPIDATTILCLQAGDVNTGEFDPFAEIVPPAKRAGAWVHVDGAFGLWARASSHHLAAGVDGADSWTADGHKWLNTPYDGAFSICRDADILARAMSSEAVYAPAAVDSQQNLTLEFSRRARGVPIWAALRTLGRAGLRDLVDRHIAMAQAIGDGLAAAGYEVLNRVVLNQVLVRAADDDETIRICRAVQASGEAWFGLTHWDGRPAMRISVSSWRTADRDVAALLELMRRQASLRAK